MFARRTRWNESSNSLTRLKHRLELEGVKLLDLTESNPTRCNFKYLQTEMLIPLTQPGNLSYTADPRGLETAREAIAWDYKRQGIEVDPAQIFLTASTSEAYSFIFRLLCDPNDTILIPAPGYPLFEYLGAIQDVQLRPYHLNYDGQWHIDFHSLESHLDHSTKIIVLVHPNNPTGSFIKKEEMLWLIELAKKHHLAIISDEVFSVFASREDLKRFHSLASINEVLTFTLSGISKMLGLPQMKLSWAIVNGPPELRTPALSKLEMIADTYLSVSTPVQNALPEWLMAKDRFLHEISERISGNREVIQNLLHKYPAITLLPSEGGWYALLKVPQIYTEEEWVLRLLEKDHVLVYPGYFFDFKSGAYLVLSLLPEKSFFEEGLKRVLDRVKSGES